MELDENVFGSANGNNDFERYEDQPIVPDMVKPVAIYEDDVARMNRERRESNFSLQSDISIGTTSESENSLPHLRYFRTPSVIVSDHSEDTGCVTYDDIKRIQNAFHRRRKSRTGKRNPDAFAESNDKFDFGRRSESSTMSGSGNSDSTTEYYRSSQNGSPVLRRRNCGCHDGQNPTNMDDVIGDFDMTGGFDRKTLSECSSSNELSPIMSHCGSSNCSENSSRRSSVFSESSPVLVRKNSNFMDQHQRGSNFDGGTRPPDEKTNLTFGAFFHPRVTQSMDDKDLLMLEEQRSLSYDDLYLDSSINSDMSYSDLSIDFSACSSLSNLPGTVYYHSYRSPQDCNSSCRSSKIDLSTADLMSDESRNDSIKTSKSCSDFLSVSRITEDYPHLKHRRHSNDQVILGGVSAYRSDEKSDSKSENRNRWTVGPSDSPPAEKINNGVYRSDTVRASVNNARRRLLGTLSSRSLHESLNFQDENRLVPNRKSKSSESVLVREGKKGKISFEGWENLFRRTRKPHRNHHFADAKENKGIKVADDNKKVTAKTDWLSVDWKNGEADENAAHGRKKTISGKNCSGCRLYGGDHDMAEGLTAVGVKTKTSGWRKLRNIVQWTPFFQTYKKQRYPWVQLAGHQGNFKAGPEQGTILKKLCPKEEKCYKILMKDVLRPYVPEYKGQVTCEDSDCIYLQLQDLLVDFASPCVLDCKLGVRTYLEEELQKAQEKPKLRKDMYEKMIEIDPSAPTLEEHRLKAVTKPRYMVWRETISSTSTLGFRLEGIRKSDGKSSKDFKTTRTKEEVKKAFRDFTDGFPHAVPKYVQRLKAIKATLEVSLFFSSHEIIGSSLLFVHDRVKANVWLIDFAKTLLLPDQILIDHKSQWVIGNHEDGYLIGVNNLIQIFTELEEEQKSQEPERIMKEGSEAADVTAVTAAAVNSSNQT